MKDDILFGISLVRVYENEMLSYNDFVSLAAKPGYSEVFEELVRRGYLKQGIAAEKALKEKEIELLNKLMNLKIHIPTEFFLENDFYNIEATAKCVYKKLSPEPLLKILSTKDSRELYNHKKQTKNSKYSHIYNEALSILKNSDNPEKCETYIKNKLTETGINTSENVFFQEWFQILEESKTKDVKYENIKMEYLKNHKYDSFSIAPIFGFFYGSLIEIRNIRTVLWGKKSGAGKEEITERLCDTYA